jgi:hypothetical protein
MYPNTFKITWGELVDRMVRYVRGHNFDANEIHLIRIFNIFRLDFV